MWKKKTFHFFTLCILVGCDTHEEPTSKHIQREQITRNHNEFSLNIPPPEKAILTPYPWENESKGIHPKITKDFFRCKGSTLNPPRVLQEQSETKRFFDCGGAGAHSLPLCDGKEFIYPILLNLLNNLQEQTGEKVIITSGHRCPDHNAYVDQTKGNRYSKHQIGAEVSFYIRGFEEKPEVIINLLQKYYCEMEKYQGLKEYQEFQRWEKQTDVAIKPWYNREIFIKLYQKGEGRNFDNRHPYPYISVQVRYDYDAKKNVSYSWDKAFRNYMRW